MKKLPLEKRVFTTKQVAILVLVVVAIIAFIGRETFKDFVIKFFAFGIAAELIVILFATFLNDEEPKK